MKTLFKRLFTFLLSLSMLTMFSCKETDNNEPDLTSASELEELVVSDNFSWRTKNSIEISINTPFDGIISILSTDKQITYARGLTQNQSIKKRISVPIYVENILIEMNGQTNTIALTEDEIEYDFISAKSFSNKSIYTDSDNDGIDDSADDYPNDASRAFDNYFPANNSGRLAFEDTWPAKADYDFNDLVIDYRFQVVTDANDYVVEIFGTFDVQNVGAGYNNGFGFQLDWNDETWYSSVTGVVGNDFESGQNYATVILFDSVGVANEGTSYNVHFVLNNQAATDWDVWIDGWNPFLIADGDRDKEIHLPYYPPTSLADLSYFGTNYDNANPEDWNWLKMFAPPSYLTAAYLPWAIDVDANFNWTVERISVDQAYLHFVDWAQGYGYYDWWLPGGETGLETGYRDPTKIE